ncbi:hypothetical protein Q0M94_14165 [Deinococcus radiomollis]|uniref:hypothetical protein n=1 Tax=Deinococcus radiomollis TaxID=468916 RepID=UPI003891DE14
MSATTVATDVREVASETDVSQTEPDQPTPSRAEVRTPFAADLSAKAVPGSGLIPAACNVHGLAVYVDVDETLMRHYGTRQIPIPSVIKQVKALYKQGAELYCWSSMGAAYARQAAESCGVAQCFQAFLPKPQIIVDDQQPKAWRKILHVHPSQCSSQTTVEEYREELKKPRSL